MIDIILVTHKNKSEVADQIKEIEENTPEPHKIIATCRIGKSAAINRNYGIEKSTSEIFVMMDDDITGFYPGWLTDLTYPFPQEHRIMVASIRCLNPDGSIGPMMGGANVPSDNGVWNIAHCGYMDYRRVPTACIAVRKNDVRYDEGFLGSGYEDTAYMNWINRIYPGSMIVINNDCKLIHKNNMQNQGGKYFKHNKEHYLSIFPGDPTVMNQTDWTV